MVEIYPIEQMKVLSYYNEIKDIFKGNIPVPRTVEIFISDDCNHKCVGCHSSMLHEEHIGKLNIKVVKKVIRELSTLGVEGIEISGGGEPLLHPNIVEFMECVNEKMVGGMITNGTVITEKIGDSIVENLRFVRIALDAGSKDVYEKIHRVNHFKILKNNIRYIVKRKQELKSNITIGLKYLVSEKNYFDIIKATELAKSLGVDYIQFKALRRDENTITDLVKVSELIEDSKKLANNSFKVMGSIEKTFLTTPCVLTPIHPTIDASGNVYLCAFWQYRRDSFNIGNIKNQTFKEIWYSERHIEAIKSIKIDECNYFDCPLHIPNYIAHEAIKEGNMHLEFV